MILAVLALALSQAANPGVLFQEALALQKQERWADAAARYERILKVQPRSLPARSNYGVVLGRMGQYEKAAAQYQQALAIDPRQDGVRLNLALAWYNLLRMPDAVSELQRVHARQPANQQVLLLLADSWLRMGENKKVVALLQPHAQQQDPAAAYLLGTALIRDEQTEAGGAIINSLFRDGDSAEALLLMGSFQFASQENRKAIETLERALAKNAALPGLYSLYGQARLTDGDPPGARAAFLKELQQNPNDYDANLQLGTMYRIEKDYENAARYLKKAELLRPRDLALQYQLASMEMANGDTAKAVRMLESITKQAPDFVEGHITLATGYYRMKRKADGDRERAIIEQLNQKAQKKDLKVQ
jgi:tetratricopeptide (TPR) repeat protein